ncbi:MAG: hypothetical protein CMN30_08350 [Sandaracinus sp.]|nr:hypothetical protein [Sandaracinus sp.]
MSDRVQVGDRFGRWRVIRHSAPIVSGRRRSACLVECLCGRRAVRREDKLKSGATRGCRDHGCQARAMVARELRGEP